MSITDKDKLITLIKFRIQNAELSKAVIDFMTKDPDHYFWTVPASSSGKYHPTYALGEGGLVRHTIAAMLIAEDMLTISTIKDPNDQDIVYASLAMHDFCKQGLPPNNSRTIFEHPMVGADEWINFAQAFNCPRVRIDPAMVDTIAGCIRSHMGQWNTNKFSRTELPIPVTKLQRFVHACDYLASRKRIEVDMNFDSVI